MNLFESGIKTRGQARQCAINYQAWASKQNLSYAEIIAYTNTLSKIAKKFNLVEEFKENGII